MCTQHDTVKKEAENFLIWALEYIAPPRPKEYRFRMEYKAALKEWEAKYYDARMFLIQLAESEQGTGV